MATDEYNFNFNQFTKPSPGGSAGGIAGKAGSSSSADSAMLTKLAKLITQLYKEQSKQSAKILEAAAAKMIRGALSSASGGMDAAATNKMVKQMSKEVADGVAKGMLKSVSGAVSKSSGGIGAGGIDETKLSKSIASGIDKSVDRQSKLLAAELRKRTGVPIDEAALARALSGAVKNAFPKSTETALKDFTQAAGSLKNLGRDISRLVQVIGSMRKSGGGVDISEIGPVISSLKVIFKDFKQLSIESTKAKESLKALGEESKETINQLSKAIDDFKRQAGRTVTGVKQRAADDPVKFRREMISAVSTAISKSSTLKDTEFGKAVKALEGKQGDITKLTNEFKKFYGLLSKQAKGGKVKIEGIEEVLREFGKISANIGNVPKQFGANAPKGWSKAAKEIDTVLNRVANLSQEFRVVINDKDLKKLEKLQKLGPITVDLAVETKRAYNDIVNATRSALDEASKTGIKTKMEIAPVVKDIKVGFETGDLDKLIKNLDKLSSKFPSTLKATGPQAEVARKSVVSLREARGQVPTKSGTTLKDVDKRAGNAFEKLSTNIDKINKDVETAGAGKAIREMSDSAITLSQRLGQGARDVGDLSAVKKIPPKVSELQKSIDLVNSHIRRGTLTPAKPTSEVTTQRLPSIKNAQETADRMRTNVYPQRLIRPDMTKAKVEGPAVRGQAKKIRMEVDRNIAGLAKSLEKLQTTIIKELDAAWTSAKSGWDIIREPGAKPKDVFEHTGGRTGGRQWKIDIANVASLREETGSKETSTKKLLEQYIDKYTRDNYGKEKKSPEDLSKLIGQWLKTVTEDQINSTKGLERWAERLNKKRNLHQGKPFSTDALAQDVRGIGTEENIREIFRKTAGESKARADLREKSLLRTITIPAAKTTGTGGAAFETQHGAKRGLPQFAVFKTGFESIYDSLITESERAKKALKDIAENNITVSKADYEKLLNIKNIDARKYGTPVQELGIRPSAADISKTGEALAKKMLGDLAKANRGAFDAQYKRAGVSVGLKQEAGTGVPAGQFAKKIEDLANKNVGESVDVFISAMEKAGVKAYDVVRSLDRIQFENVYDVYQKMLTSGKAGATALQKLAAAPYFDKSIRDFETAIGQLEGALPLVEGARPRRGIHQEKVTHLMTRTSPLYGEKPQNLQAPQQKQLIKDLNLRINEMLIEASKIDQNKITGEIAKSRRGQLPTNITTLSSLGVPESQAGKIEDYRSGAYGSNTKHLDKLNATVVKMYADNLSELAPFGAEFQQAGRNISNVTNALVGRGGIETPKLRTEREKALVESGRYGPKGQGYGYNVVAELRNTASTFEDQVVISGKLAKALTSVTKKLIKPTQFGRKDLGSDAQIVSHKFAPTTDIQAGEIDKAHREFMKILGVPEEYVGRADKALISGVEKAMSVVRGAPVEVQTAKLTEQFMNYYGRKFTTRYGSKGVGISPTGSGGEILEQFGGKEIKIKPEESLGVAMMPKTMGELASEIITKTMGEKESAQLRKQLLASGNRFIIDMFKTAGEMGVTIAPEAKKQRELFSKVDEALGGKLSSAGTGVEGIKALKALYKDIVGGETLKRTPIDVRISSYGVAKRGLQTEALESIMSNVAGYGRVGKGKEVTMKTRLGQPAYESLLGGEGEAGTLAKYSEALGYLPSEDLAGTTIGGRGRSLDRLKSKLKAMSPGKEAMAERAAELEAISSYYTKIIDEMGTERRSLVGEKFLQIIEEPGKDPGWSKREIDKGLKGAKLNLLAFPAYATIFGEQSKLLEEMAQGGGVDTKKHYEYIKALQFLNDESKGMTDDMLKSLKTVDVSQIKQFTHSTGIRGIEASKSGRGLGGTVLDTAKYPSAFNLQLPTGKFGPEGEMLKEDFYVPGASARGTYPDKLIAGEEGMDIISRRLTHITNMGRQLSDVLEKGPDTSVAREKLKKIIGGLAREAQGQTDVNRLKDIYTKLFEGLESNEPVKSGLVTEDYRRDLSETEYVKSYLKDDSIQSYKNAISQQVDILAGARSPFKDVQRQDVVSKIDRIADPNKLAGNLGVDILQDEIDKRVESLTKAKIDYYNSLAETALGKSGSVQELLFTKQIPSIMAKATTAVVDRRAELDEFASVLRVLGETYGNELSLNFKKLAETADTISTDHEDKIEKTLRAGIPVLKQHEIGIPQGLAEKVPAKFAKKYYTKGKGTDTQIKEAQTGRYGTGNTLAELITYRGELLDGLNNADKEMRKEVEAYIKDNLTPYVEAIRYPFTGISSVQPFEAKVLGKKGERGLESRSLSVPGVPEMDVQGFDKLLDALKNEASSLSEKREGQRRAMAPEEEIQKTTDALKMLESAISAATPKYVAHQMKLDFDGDEIQVHSARTAQARQEIEKHYKALTDVNNALRTTAGRYREGFTYENLPSTGENTIAEMMMAFDKKFESGKGFEFLKSPFLTKDLEYLKPQDQLSVLAKAVPDLQNNPMLAIEEVLEDLGKPGKEIAKISEVLAKVKPDEDIGKYSESLLAELRNLNAKLSKEVGAGVTTKLFESKYKDVIEAQLFKIHTGTETESMARLQRIGESTVGFGTGVMGGAGKKYQPTESFKSRYPGSISNLGIDAAGEFHTMLNEMFRFAIQKGMDVKHAGAPPIAGELVKYVSSGVGGAKDLFEKIKEDDSYGELKDLYEASQKAIMYNLGEQPTDAIRKVAGDISKARGIDLKVDEMDRGELTTFITKKIGFQGFLEELSLSVEEAAIEGLIKQAKLWQPGARPPIDVPEITGEIEDWARDVVQGQMSGVGGINIRDLVTKGENPLYNFRTKTASTYGQLKDYEAKYGNIDVPAGITESFINKDASKDYVNKYKKAKATASNLREELMRAGQTVPGQSGGYAEMVESGFKSIEEAQLEIEKIVESWKMQSYSPETGDLAGRLDRLHPTEARVVGLDPKNRHKELEKLLSLTGAPKVSDREKDALEREYTETLLKQGEQAFGGRGLSSDDLKSAIKNYTDDALEKIIALEQLDRIYAAVQAKGADTALVSSLFAGGGSKNISENIRRNKEAEERARLKTKPLDFKRTIERPTPMEREGVGRGFNMRGPGGKPIPVYLVGMEQSIPSMFKGLVTSAAPSTAAGPMESAATRMADSRLEELKELERIMSALRVGGESKSGEATFAEVYSPSRLKGGGSYGKPPTNEKQRLEAQVSEIVDTMLGTSRPGDEYNKAVLDLGTAIHEKIQKTKFKGKEFTTEELVSVPDEDTGFSGSLVGFADVVERTSDVAGKQYVKRVIDIKTTGENVVKEIKDIGSQDLETILATVEGETKRKIEDAYSQVNAYLKAMGDELREETRGEIQFYAREAKGTDDPARITFAYNPERFAQDMDAVAKARAEVMKSKGRSAFATLPSYGERVRAQQGRQDVPLEDIDAAIEYGLKALTRASERRMGGARPRGREDDSIVNDRIRRAEEKARTEVSGIGGGGYNYNEFLEAPPIAEGKGLLGVFENIKTLHEQATLYQKKYNDVSEAIFDIDDDAGAKGIKDAIDKVKKSGPSGQEFIDVLNLLQGQELITGKDAWKAWRLYRIASGQFLIDQAEDAKKEADRLFAEGDKAGSQDAYAEFERHTKRLQENIRRSVGKRTDIYTENRKFLYPELAQSAGVYLNPKQITQRATEPLGEDQELIKIFKSLTADLKQGADVIPPVEKVREMLSTLTKVDGEMVSMLTSSEKFARMGDEVQEAWTFTGLANNVTKLRAGLEGLTRFNMDDFGVVQQKNIRDMIKYLKALETAYANAGSVDFGSSGEFGDTGIVKVPTFETPTNQLAMHRRNIQKSREYARRPEEEGGLKIGETFSYPVKVIGEAGEVLENTIYSFKKYGEEITSTGDKIGRFSESQKDLIELMSRANATFGSAVRRVVMWGAASRLIYGGVSNLKSSLNELADIELGIAQLRMVMSPLSSDFADLQDKAVGFAKQYGVPVTEVLKSMKVFAQQGLAQSEVIERTRTSTLAANVTTLNAKDATEALTAAMKSFKEEGQDSLRFLDSWSEVEAKHAITAADMANAIKKSAAAAKNAGFTFDELNGIVASIGAVTRQSGKEVGTAMRFIVRRLFSEKGPKELGKLNIPTMTAEGENRRGFEVLNDLSMAWKDLTSAQKLNIAQALGGTRQYNALLVAMDNWDEALRGIRNSTNSKGSAERRNLEVMKTYAKQMEQTKAAATELKLEFGKVILPTFKTGLKAIKFLLESLSSIPGPIKAAVAALGGLFVFGAKGINIFDTLAETLSKGSAAFGSFSSQFGKQLDIAKFEVFGKQTRGLDTYGLKTIRPLAAGDEQVAPVGKSFKDFNSILGMTVYGLREVGLAYNKMLGDMGGKTGKGLENIGEKMEKLSGSLFSLKGAGKVLAKGSIIPGWVDDVILAGAGAVGEGVGAAGHVVDFVGEKAGAGAAAWTKSFADANTGLVKAIAPLAVTAIAAYKAVDGMGESFVRSTKSAQDFEKFMDRHRRQNEDQLKNIRSLSMEYGRLSDQLKQVEKASQPETKARRQDLGTYEAPLVTLQKVQREVIELSNQLADQNSALVLGYDKLGNAILKTTANFEGFLQSVDKLKVKEGVGKEIDILSRFTEDLTKTGGSEKIKQAFKDLFESTPIFGDLLGKQIKVSPAKVLEDASGRLNKLINLKNKAPLSTAVNKDVKDLQKALGKARSVFNDTYSDFDRVYKKILSRTTLKGLDQFDIEQIVGSDQLKEAYKLKLTVDPKFQLAKDITWQDIMGKELLSLTFPKAAGLVDVSSQFTKAAIESAGIKPRGKNDKGLIKALSGDLVTLTDQAAKDFDIAGNQVIIKYQKTADGIYEWVAQYFNTKTLKIEEKPIDEIEPLVDQVFPLQAIQESVEKRIDSLNTFVAGAAAGLVGLSDKAFKKDFDLGARFFSGVSTNTVLQGSKGFTPTGGYGEVPLQKDWQKEIVEFYLDPMDELRMKTDQFSKLTTEGIKDADVAESDFEQITKLLDVLKNNQIVQQFRAVWVDLMKEVSDGQRVLKENLAVQKMRNNLDRETAGLMAGTVKGLANIDTGVGTVGGLSVKQRLAATNPRYSDTAEQVQAQQTQLASIADMIAKAERALVAIDTIDVTAAGFGAKLSPDELKKFVEDVAVDQTPQEKLLKPAQATAKSTAEMSTKLDEMLANMGDNEALTRQWERVTKYLGTGATAQGSDSELVKAMDRAVKIRGKVEKTGDQQAIALINDTIDKLVNKLIDQRGFTGAANLVGTQGLPFTTQITKDEFIQRAAGGANTEVLIDTIKRYAPKDTGGAFGFFKKSSFEQSKQLGDLRKLQESDGKSSIKGIRQVAKATAAATAIAAYRKAQSTRVIKKYDEQIKKLDEQIKQGKESGKTEKELRDLSKQRIARVTLKAESQKGADFYGMVTALSAMTTGTTELGMALGLTEKQVKLLGVGAVGTYAAVKLASKVTGKEMPESAKKFGQAMKDATAKSLETGTLDRGGIKNAGALGKAMAKDLAKKSRTALGPVSAGITRNVKEIDVDRLAAEFEKAGPTGDYESLIRESFGEDIERLALRTAGGVNAEESAKNIQAAIVAFAAATMADFIAKQSGDKVRLATLSKRAEEQGEAWIDIAEKYPLAFQKALDYLNGRVKDAEDTAGGIATEERSLVQDANKQKGVMKDAIKSNFIEPLVEEFNTIRDKVVASLQGMSLSETIEGNIKVLEDLAKAERQRRDELAITSRYNQQARLNPSLSGFVEGPGAPLLEEQMSTQQRVFAESDQSYKNILTQYASVNQSVDAMVQNMKNLKTQIGDSNDIINSGLVDETAIKTQKALIEDYNQQLINQEEILNNTIKKLREFAETKQALDGFSSSVHNLKNALKDINIQETVDGLLVGFRSNMSNLFGGGGLMAPQMVTPREELDAARVGIRLTNMVSTQYDKMRADLTNRLEGAEGMDAIRIRQDLRNIPELMRRQEEGEGQRTEIENLRRQLAPYEQNITDLARAQVLPGMGSDQRVGIGQMMQNRADLLERATEVVSPEILIKELTDALTQGYVEQPEFDEAKALINQAGDRQFRGVPFWADRMLNQLPSGQIEEALKAAPTFDMLEMETAVTNPITDRLDINNYLLKAIASKEFGVDIEHLKALENKLTDKAIAGRIEEKAAAEKAAQPPAKTTEEQMKDYTAELKKNAGKEIYLKTPPESEARALAKGMPDMMDVPLPPAAQNFREWGATPSDLWPYNVVSNQANMGQGSIMDPPYDISKTFSNIHVPKIGYTGKEALDWLFKEDPETKARKEERRKLKEQIEKQKKMDEEYGKASGGRIFGEGGPREDKVPAYLSPGEFVIRAASAQKLGYTNLEAMNDKGTVPGFGDGGSYRINPKTGRSFHKPDVKKVMNPNLAGVLGAAGAIGKGAIDLEAWKELLGIGALQRIYEGKAGILDYAEAGMMTLPGAAALGKLTAGGTKLATTTGKGIMGVIEGLSKAKKAKNIAPDIAKELGLDISMANAKKFPQRGMPEGIEKYLTDSNPAAKLPKASPDRIMSTKFESVELGKINKLLTKTDDTVEGKRILENALETYKGKKSNRDSLIEVLENAKADKDLLREIAGFDEFVGHGAESIVLGGTTKKTAGQVIRLSDMPFSDEYLKGIGVSRHVNPIQGSKMFEKSGIQAIKSEKLEPATSVVKRMHEKARKGALSAEERLMQDAAQDAPHKMRYDLMDEGKINAIDMSHSGNVGYTASGQAKVIDYGAVAPTHEMGLEHAAKVMKASKEIQLKKAAIEEAARKKKGVLQGMDFSDEVVTGGYAIDFDVDNFSLAEGGVVGWSKEKLEQAKEYFKEKINYSLDPNKIEGAGVRKHYKEMDKMVEELEQTKKEASKNKFADGMTKKQEELIKSGNHVTKMSGFVTGLTHKDLIKLSPDERFKKMSETYESGKSPIGPPKKSILPLLANPISDKKGRWAEGEEPLLDPMRSSGEYIDPDKARLLGYHKPISMPSLVEPYMEPKEEKSVEDTGPKFIGHTSKTKHDKLERPKFAQELYKRDADKNPRAPGRSAQWFLDAQAKRKAVKDAWKEEAKVTKQIELLSPTKPPELPKSLQQDEISPGIYTWVDDNGIKHFADKPRAASEQRIKEDSEFAKAMIAQGFIDERDDKGGNRVRLWGRVTAKAAIDAQKAYSPLPDRGVLDYLLPEEYARAGAMPSFGLQAQYDTPMHRKMQVAKGEGLSKREESNKRFAEAKSYTRTSMPEDSTKDTRRGLIIDPSGLMGYQSISDITDAALKYAVPEKYRGQTSANDPEYVKEQNKIKELRAKQNELYEASSGDKALADTSGQIGRTGQQLGMGADKVYHGQTLAMLESIIKAKPDDPEFLKTILKHRNNLQNIVTNMSRGMPFPKTDEARAVAARKLIATPFAQDIIDEEMSAESGLNSAWMAYNRRPALYKEYMRKLEQYGSDGSKWPDKGASKEELMEILNGGPSGIVKTRPTVKQAILSSAILKEEQGLSPEMKALWDHARERKELEKLLVSKSTMSPKAVDQVAKKIKEAEKFIDNYTPLRGAEGGSLPVYHHGGEIRKTGSVFAQKGEVILPRSFADGGMVDDQTMSQSLTKSSISVDTTELKKIMEQPLKVEEKELKVEDKELRVVETELEVKQPEWKIEVDQPESVTVTLDTGDAESRLSSSISDAINNATLTVEATGTTGVGGQELNQLTESMSQINDRVFELSTDYNEEIKMINTKLASTAEIDLEASVRTAVDSQLTTINKNLSDTNSNVDRVRSSLERSTQHQQQLIADLEYKLNIISNKSGV